jgi:hypothetical protein
MLEKAPRASSGDSKDGTPATAAEPPMATFGSRPQSGYAQPFHGDSILQGCDGDACVVLAAAGRSETPARGIKRCSTSS